MNSAKIVCYPSKKYLYIYYTKNNKTLKISTDIKIENINQFDFDKQQLKKQYTDYRNVNILLSKKLNDVNTLIAEAIFNNLDVVEYVKTNLAKPKGNTFDILSSFDEYIKQLSSNTSKTRSLAIQKAIKDLKIKIIDSNFTANIVKYLTKNNYASSTILKMVQNVKKYLKYVRKNLNNDVLNDNLDYKVRSSYKASNIIFNFDEIQAIKHYESMNKNEQLVKDFIIFGCLVGCHFKDLIHLNKSKLKNINETLCIVYYRQKTKIECIVPISQEAHEIMEKYNYNFNIITYQNFRLNFKKLLNKIDLFNNETNILNQNNGIETTVKRKDILTFKSTRKYFITKCLNDKIAVTSIMKMIGHSNISEMNNYLLANINDADIDILNEQNHTKTDSEKLLSNMNIIKNNLEGIEISQK